MMTVTYSVHEDPFLSRH